MSTAQIAEKKSKKATTKVAPKKVDVEAPAPAAVEAAPAAIEKKEKKSKKRPAEAPAEDAQTGESAQKVQVVEESKEGAAEESSDEKLSRKKRTYVQLVAEVDQLNTLVDQYIVEHREPKNTDMNRFLKGLEKGLRKVRVHVQKIGKNRTSAQSAPGIQSGFQKPVRISSAVAQFTGWSADEPRARVEVTNFVCDYIKQNNLQSPEDRRVILADQRLSELLDYQSERDGNLTYATIQKLLAKHYTPLAA
jgi:chromatin remodeling complex protein RSC6